VQFVFSLLVMALIGNIIAMAFAGNPATINYSMFTATFSIVSLFYLVPASFNINWAIHPIIMIVLDVLNNIFFLTCAIALAAKLECHSCSNDVRCDVRTHGFQRLTSLELHPQQRNHQRRTQPSEAMP
jgi:hypothetical protein